MSKSNEIKRRAKENKEIAEMKRDNDEKMVKKPTEDKPEVQENMEVAMKEDEKEVGKSSDAEIELKEKETSEMKQENEEKTINKPNKDDSENKQNKKAAGMKKVSKMKEIGTIEENDDSKTIRRPKDCILTANFPGLVDLVSDGDQRVKFLIKTNKVFHVDHYKVNGVDSFPPEMSHLMYKPVEVRDVLYHCSKKEDYVLFEDIQNYLGGLAYLTKEQNLIATNYVYLTYLQDNRAINFMPILLLYGPPERGKTRFGKAVVSISHRGITTNDVREADIFRKAEYWQATLFFDVMDMWKRLENGGLRDLILNRYEKSGSKVSRVLFPEKGAFRDTKYFNVFGPTIIATNKSVGHILETRTLDIHMQNRPDEYPYSFEHKQWELKARLIAWRAKMMNTNLEDVKPIDGFKGRFWDISKPLLMVCNKVCRDNFNALVKALLQLAEQRSEQKKNTDDYLIVEILAKLINIGNNEGNRIKLSYLVDEFNEERTEYKYTSQKMGRTLGGLGIETKRDTGYSMITINKNLHDLFNQYGLSVTKGSIGNSGNSGNSNE